MLHIVGGDSARGRERAVVVSIETVEQRALAGSGDQYRDSTCGHHSCHGVLRPVHHRCQRLVGEKLGLAFIERAALFIGSRTSELTPYQYIDSRGSCAALVCKKFICVGFYTDFIAHALPSTCMPWHRVVEHTVHIEKHGLGMKGIDSGALAVAFYGLL